MAEPHRGRNTPGGNARICRLTRWRTFFNQLNMRNLILHANNQLVFFFLCGVLRVLYRQIKVDQSVSKQKHAQANRLVETWTNRHLDEVGEMLRQRQKAYNALAMTSEALTRPPWFDWRHGQGFQYVLALHLHLLIKCHNNMIFNFQQVPPRPPLLRRDRQQ